MINWFLTEIVIDALDEEKTENSHKELWKNQEATVFLFKNKKYALSISKQSFINNFFYNKVYTEYDKLLFIQTKNFYFSLSCFREKGVYTFVEQN